ADDDVVGLEQRESLRNEVEVDRQVHVDRDEERLARAADELAEREPDAALWKVEERHLSEAPAEIGPERRGATRGTLPTHQHLVAAAETLEKCDQALRVRHEDGLLVVHRDADGERRHGLTSARRSPAYFAHGVSG